MHHRIRLISEFHINILSHSRVLLRAILRNEMQKFFYFFSASAAFSRMVAIELSIETNASPSASATAIDP